MRRRMIRATPLILLAPMILFVGCGGEIADSSDVKLGVPYRAQDPNSFDCGPASVLMWRLYDGKSEISQQTIGSWMGGTGCGSSQQSIVAAVNHFTATSDAFWDLTSELDYQEFFSRQITSIDNGVPVIPILYGGLHAAVINGGKWHENADADYQWDYVYLHDPLTRSNDQYSADLWRDTNCPSGSPCEQIASQGASGAWSSNLQTYGGDVVLGGGGGGRGGDPIEY